MAEKIRVTVWNEYRHEREIPKVAAIYPQGIHAALAAALNTQADIAAATATLDEADNGLGEKVLAATDVLMWWGHKVHDAVADATVDRVQTAVLKGMGLIVLHSGHYSKIFRRLMGTTCQLMWREAGERELLWTARPGHPILAGVPNPVVLEHTEMYGEPFDIPEPDETVLISSFAGGEVFRSGITYRRGAGKVFYFRPGHETYPIYHDPVVQRILINAVRWARPSGSMAIELPCRKMNWWQQPKPPAAR
jgi:trehalose utilization protein